MAPTAWGDLRVGPRLISARPIWPLLLIGAVLRLVNLNAPVLGVHSWRQADTAAIARNAFEAGLPFWLPQVDWGGASSGFAETDPPLYSQSVAWLYGWFGVQEWLARGLSLLLSLIALWLLVRLGQQLVGTEAGWWGGLLFAVLPLSVFYGRSIQPESLLLACSALALERGLAWCRKGRSLDLAWAAIGLTGAVLIKVLPALWLGLPLLWLAWLRHGPALWRRLELWLIAAVVLGLTGAWYWHAHQLFLQTGLSFGFWGAGANRYSWAELIGLSYWGNLLLRSSVRGLAVLGLPLLVMGLLKRNGQAEARLLPIGLAAVLVAGALAPESSSVHEYYQLPLLLFACPLMGLGWVQLWEQASRRARRVMACGMALLMACSITVLSLDYWAKEQPSGNPTWELAQRIKQDTPPGARIISVTGGDPTLLYLAHRKGWLKGPGAINRAWLDERAAEGATHIAGSWEVIQSYARFPDNPAKTRLKQLLGPEASQGTSYLVALPLQNDAPGSQP
jgi:4-amino-4-deoxy-L-arabinose transferase-like glycosyltransferase